MCPWQYHLLEGNLLVHRAMKCTYAYAKFISITHGEMKFFKSVLRFNQLSTTEDLIIFMVVLHCFLKNEVNFPVINEMQGSVISSAKCPKSVEEELIYGDSIISYMVSLLSVNYISRS